MKEPETFEGNRYGAKTDINTFVAQISAYVTDTTGWKDDAHKVRVASSYLRGNAYMWVSSYLALDGDELKKPEYHWITDFEAYKKKLLTTFGDPDKETNDANRLDNLRQTGAASLYAAEFRRLALSLGWGVKALRHRFVKGLKEELKDELSRNDPIEDFDALVERVVVLDNRLFQRRLQKTGRGSAAPTVAPFPAAFAPPSRPYTPAIPGAGDPMQVDATRTGNANSRPRGPLTQQEKDYRRQNGLCGFCGQAGHIATDAACSALMPAARSSV